MYLIRESRQCYCVFMLYRNRNEFFFHSFPSFVVVQVNAITHSMQFTAFEQFFEIEMAMENMSNISPSLIP